MRRDFAWPYGQLKISVKREGVSFGACFLVGTFVVHRNVKLDSDTGVDWLEFWWFHDCF